MPALATQGLGQAVLGLVVVWLQADGRLVMGDGLVEIAQGLIGRAQVLVVGGRVGIEGERLLDELNRAAVVAALIGDDAEQVIGVRMLGPRGQDAAVERHRFLEPPGLVVFERARQRLADGRHDDRVVAEGMLPRQAMRFRVQWRWECCFMGRGPEECWKSAGRALQERQ